MSDLQSNKTIIDIQYYDPSDDAIGIALHDLPREWQYVSVAKLSSKNINGNGTLLEKASPRSQQEAAGIQLAGDNK